VVDLLITGIYGAQRAKPMSKDYLGYIFVKNFHPLTRLGSLIAVPKSVLVLNCCSNNFRLSEASFD
jgi:hypothetical protein